MFYNYYYENLYVNHRDQNISSLLHNKKMRWSGNRMIYLSSCVRMQYRYTAILTCIYSNWLVYRAIESTFSNSTQSNTVYVISYIVSLYISERLILSIPHFYQTNYVFPSIGKREKQKLILKRYSCHLSIYISCEKQIRFWFSQ